MLLAGRVDLWPASATELSIVPGQLKNDWCIDRIPKDAKLDWDALERYRRLRELSYDGEDAALIPWLAKHRTISSLSWEGHRLTTADFRRTGLTSLTIAMRPTLTLRLPTRLTELRLNYITNAEKVRIEGARDGAGLSLGILMSSARAPTIPAGLSRIRTLTISFARAVKAKALLACPDVDDLTLHGDGSFIMTDVQHLAGLTRLRRLQLSHAYGLDARRFPLASAFPKLEYVEIYGVTKLAAEILRERLAGIDLTLSGVRRH
jgi:hypothetical protein